MDTTEQKQPTDQSVESAVEKRADAVFLRKASGVIREMSSRDGMYFGYLAATGIYGLAIIMFAGASTFPNANVLVSLCLCYGFMLVIDVVYASLASAMPRSGADYVFTSRLLHPSIGVVISWTSWLAIGFFFTYLAATTIVNGFIAPMFSAISVATGNGAWSTAAEQVQQNYLKIPIALALVLIANWIMLRNIGLYSTIQKRFMMPASIIGILIILVSYLFWPVKSFFEHFTEFQNNVGGLTAAQVIPKAADLGFVANGSVFWDTLAVAFLMMFLMISTMYGTELLGEIKGANQLKTTTWMYFGGATMQFVTFLIGIVGAYWYFGQEWLTSFCWLALNHPDALGGSWDFRGVATLFYLPSMSLALGIILFVCFTGPASQSLFNPTLAASRLILAMSLDRVLPSWFGGVNKRGSPHHAVWFCTICGLTVGVLSEVVGGVLQFIFWGSWMLLFGVGLVVLSGSVFPFGSVGRSIYNVSPGRNLKVFGFPLITICSVVGYAWVLLLLLVNIFYPPFGSLEPGPARVGLYCVIAVITASFASFWVARAVRKREGIEIDYAFKVVPRG